MSKNVYEKRTLATFLEKLEAGEYKGLSGARRAASKAGSSWPKGDLIKAQAAINEYYEVDEEGGPSAKVAKKKVKKTVVASKAIKAVKAAKVAKKTRVAKAAPPVQKRKKKGPEEAPMDDTKECGEFEDGPTPFLKMTIPNRLMMGFEELREYPVLMSELLVDVSTTLYKAAEAVKFVTEATNSGSGLDLSEAKAILNTATRLSSIAQSTLLDPLHVEAPVMEDDAPNVRPIEVPEYEMGAEEEGAAEALRRTRFLNTVTNIDDDDDSEEEEEEEEDTDEDEDGDDND